MNPSKPFVTAAIAFSLGLCPALSSAQSAPVVDMSAAAPTVAITGGKLLTITHGVIENGTIVLSGGKIAAVGTADSVKIPDGAQIVDAKGMTVYPGLIDSETNLGLSEIEADDASNDLVETSDEIFPNMHVYDAFHAETEHIPITRLNGITNAIVAPASDDSLPGQDIFIQLAGRDRDQMILGKDVALPMNFSGEQRRRGNGGVKFPSTRMGLASQLRQTFIDAQAYAAAKAEYQTKLAKWQKGDKKEPAPTEPKIDLKSEALLPYLRGEKPVVLAAYEGYEIEVDMQIAQEFHLKVILNHVTHSQEILDKIAAYKVPVIVGPIYDFPAANERYDSVFTLPAELSKRGVKIAFSSAGGSSGNPGGFERNLPYAAGYAVAYGLPYDEALKAITLNPAEMWGVADKLGSLDAGKLANVVIANGDPLDVRTDVKQVYIEGHAIPMVSRQTRLRDEYSK
ncbi:imidazolonepropionase-like amidohydrolase [Silvibacterium bohemicum]|uniref:Imidazolonepropionase-like amidohydrolase n=1 Tax=Silvibacterium bohemicum TaxID=1577686 RepID=A0A841JSE0_9BACT|nr:amidohydrolase family protein [Silvibacterium bohemicum]MBB6144226.1 imidazolonepropionase-like amidohydrolase [Silvibacterium bohemicum]